MVSDELDEIKVRLDTLHEDLEQGAIDQIDSRINDLMTQIQAKNVSCFRSKLFSLVYILHSLGIK